MPFFVVFFFFALTLAIIFPYFLYAHTFLLSTGNMKRLHLFLFASTFILSIDRTKHRLFAFTQQGRGWNITIAIIQVHAGHSSSCRSFMFFI
jgi:hypothetical protein